MFNDSLILSLRFKECVLPAVDVEGLQAVSIPENKDQHLMEWGGASVGTPARHSQKPGLLLGSAHLREPHCSCFGAFTLGATISVAIAPGKLQKHLWASARGTPLSC